MATFKSSPMASLLPLLLLLVSASALDMSIIDYDKTHPANPPRIRTEAETEAIYEKWLVKHGKAYNGIGEKERRFEIFKDNMRFVDEENAVGGRGYKVGLNRFADLTNEEFRSRFLGGKVEMKARAGRAKSDRYVAKDGEELAEAVDWRGKGAVGSVKDQGQCGNPFFFT